MTLAISRAACAFLIGAWLCSPVWADEAQIRKNLSERLAGKSVTIDEVSKTPVPGIYEVRMGSEVLYADEEGHHVIEGQLIDLQTQTNLTEARVSALSGFEFAKLPFKDAVVWKSGTGARKFAVFSDPNCGYCKGLEVELRQLKNVTIYTFLIPVIGPDSAEKSKNVWCAKDKTQTWLDWMLKEKLPPAASQTCNDEAMTRNVALAKKHRVRGTPALVFSDNSRVPGAMSAEQIEKRLAALPKS